MNTELALNGTNAETERTQSWAKFGLRREAKRHAAFDCRSDLRKAVSPLRFATALQIFASLLLCVFALIPSVSPAATNDLTSALQKGLFEEEANHNLDAAAQAYQTVSTQFDKDRTLAATAIFRLGEVYRKQNKTNEATAQYERIVREFSDQGTLVTLSRQNLAGLGANQRTTSAVEPRQTVAIVLTPEAEELARTEKILAQLRGWDLSQLRRLIPALVPDAEFERLDKQLGLIENYGKSPPDDQVAKQRDKMKDLLAERAEIILNTLRTRVDSLKTVVAKQKPSDKLELPLAASADAAPTDDEEKEIRRIQEIIKSSPDLINAPASEGGITPLCNAARLGQLRVAKFLLDAGAVVDLPSGGSSPIHNAAAGGHKAMVELLLDRGADVNARASSGRSPIHTAAENGFQSVVETLLARKADVNAQTKEQETPLLLAATKGHSAMVDVLITKGAQLDVKMRRGKTALMAAAIKGHSLVIKRLLDARADPNIADDSGLIALSYAVQGGHTDVVNALLKAKADPNAGSAESPLLLAVRADNAALAESLLRTGADPNQATDCDLIYLRGIPNGTNSRQSNHRGKRTPLQAAVIEEYPAMAKLLLQFKGDPKARAEGDYPLVTITLNNTNVLKAFLEAGADPNAKDYTGQPLIVSAAQRWDSARIELLLAHDANVKVHGENNWMALHWAVQQGGKKSAELLLAAKADVNAKNNAGWTPLHLAVSTGNAEIIKFLLAHGADANLRNENGQTPLDLAKGNNNTPTPGLVFAVPGVPLPLAPGIPARTPQQPAGSKTPSKTEPVDIAALLREHGALDDVPRLDRIEVRRPLANYSAIAFQVDTNGWNEFSLLELIALHYGLITTERNAALDTHQSSVPSRFWRAAACQFPDLSRVIIRRPASASANPQWKEIAVNVAELLDSGDCARDVKLAPGDIVEIPEADHPVNEQWTGLAWPQTSNLLHCVSRTVTISIKGTPTTIQLSPELKPTNSFGPYGERMNDLTKGSFMLKSVLAQTRLLRASSDLSRIRITRRAGAGGKAQEWVLNCESGNDPNLWLRDGDVIEVPDKP